MASPFNPLSRDAEIFFFQKKKKEVSKRFLELNIYEIYI